MKGVYNDFQGHVKLADMHNLLFSWCVKTLKFSKFLAKLLAEQIFFHVPKYSLYNVCSYECKFGRGTRNIN
ncbi:hypothetical protein [Clostridium saccharoperbutylacetonicum]|uniref:hypothetical protein n=1 Tax=Clostridium saccharoperbutylacetonicum TaxID=36745 RepID=UPI0039EC6AB5